ncbi:hypothetical protein NT239_04785 [Chitinibacter sp. SCUT-21]|uniref:hypothetical protein n=1 Tax=Chitinibacter sp. SCUT-21 TaxID=2970891 RepID=UPI0035A5FD9C
MDTPQWGWDEGRAIGLLNFWHEFDPQIRFVLVYTPPSLALSQQLVTQELNQTAIAGILKDWHDSNNELLQFYHRHASRCILVNGLAIAREPQSLLQEIETAWGIQLNTLPDNFAVNTADISILAANLYQAYCENQTDAHLLYCELENSANIHLDGVSIGNPEIKIATREYIQNLTEKKLHLDLVDRKKQLETQLQSATEQHAIAHQALTTEIEQITNKNKIILDQLLSLQEEQKKTLLAKGLLEEQLHAINEQIAIKAEEHASLQQTLTTEVDQLHAENETLLIQLHSVQEELEKAFLAKEKLNEQLAQLEKSQHAECTKLQQLLSDSNAKLLALQTSRDQLSKEVERLETETKNRSTLQLDETELKTLKQEKQELSEENELLLLQLHQVQEELENYYLKYRELTGQESLIPESHEKYAATFWRHYQPTDFVVDLRREFDGTNWYDAEADGRWAGPNDTSLIRIPPLQGGRYSLELFIVDAMSPEIAAGVTMALNGSALVTQQEYEGYPTLIKAEFDTQNISPRDIWELTLGYPALISPADHGSDDNRQLAIRLRSVRITRIA